MRRAGESGAALVEFALVSLVAYFLVAGGVEVGRMIFISQALQDAARVAAREMAVTPLPGMDPFETALQQSGIFDENVLVIDSSCPYTDDQFDAYWASLPLVNRMLRPLYVSETVVLDGETTPRRLLHYPGALVKVSTPVVNPCALTYSPGDQPTDLSVKVVRVKYDPDTGKEADYELVPILSEVRTDPDEAKTPENDKTSPFRMDQQGTVNLAINYPFQSAALSFFHRSTAGPLEPNAANRILADDTFAGSHEPALKAGEEYANPEAALPGSAVYSGPLGLGKQFAFAQSVRPYRNLITGQAIFRREVFSQ
jgi:hypothetical protein